MMPSIKASILVITIARASSLMIKQISHNQRRSWRIINTGEALSHFTFKSKIYQQPPPVSTTTTLLDDELATISSNSYETTTRRYESRDMQHVLTTAEKAAFQAGDIMRSTFGKIAVSKTKMNDKDLVTESDIQCQNVIKGVIQSEFPQDDFLGEEDAGVGSKASSDALRSAVGNVGGSSESKALKDERMTGAKLLWIVDPIDGTTNFQAGLCMFCVSIGVVSLEPDGPVVVAGVIYNPVLNEMVSAVRGRGCYVNGEQLKPKELSSTPHPLKRALINVGFPVSSDSALNASSRAVAALATKVRGLRMIASASQVMSWVAQGKLSAYISWDLNSWDVAAGMVIVEEAGGFVSNFDGTRADISSRDLIVTCSEENSSHALNRDIRKVLTEHGCLNY